MEKIRFGTVFTGTPQHAVSRKRPALQRLSSLKASSDMVVRFGEENAKTFKGILETGNGAYLPKSRIKARLMEENPVVVDISGQWRQAELTTRVVAMLTQMDQSAPAALPFLATHGWKFRLEPYLIDKEIPYRMDDNSFVHYLPTIDRQEKRIVLTNRVCKTNQDGKFEYDSKPNIFIPETENKPYCVATDEHNLTRGDVGAGIATAINQIGQPHPNALLRKFKKTQKFSDSPEFRKALRAEKNAINPLEVPDDYLKKSPETLLVDLITELLLSPDKQPDTPLRVYTDALLKNLKG